MNDTGYSRRFGKQSKEILTDDPELFTMVIKASLTFQSDRKGKTQKL